MAKHLKHIRYATRRYVMTPEESTTWDTSDDTDRRKFLGLLGDRLASEATPSGGCHLLFYHSSGRLVAKTVHHEPLFDGSTP